MAAFTSVTRRQFIKLTGMGGSALILGFAAPWACAKNSQVDLEDAVFEPNAWVKITSDDTITVYMPRSEMGQKVWTALPMILADELEADWSKVKVTQGHLNAEYGNQTTGGSKSVRTNYDALRKAGATTREMLITAAANTWGVAPEECRAERNQIIHTPTGKKLSYGDLVPATTDVPVPDNAPLKDPRDFKIIGRSFKSIDTAFKVDGSLDFGWDRQETNMRTVVISRCPVFSGKVATHDAAGALSLEGVEKVLEVPAGIAVIARDTWSAIQGRRQLKIEWDPGDNAKLDSKAISAELHKNLDSPKETLRQDGNPDAAIRKANQVYKATFEVPYLDHAPMEPMNCTVFIHDKVCEVWAPTQNPGAAFRAAQEITGFDDAQIHIYTDRMGGGFGRRLQADFVADAVAVAQQVNAPVKVIRTRDEDIQHGFYRPASVHRVAGALGKYGFPTVWTHRVSGPVPWHGLYTGGAAELAYDIPNQRIDYAAAEIPVPVGAWRSVAHTQTAFVNECWIDELAEHAGMDPVEYRRKLLKHHPRHLGVLNLVAEKSGWGKPLPTGHAQGVAVHFSYYSWAAVVAEVSLDARSNLKIHRMDCAVDCGTVINPDGVAAQVEGGVTLALTAALYGEISLKNGRVQQSNFHNYRLLTMSEAPVIHTHIVKSTEKPTGIGEPPVPPTPPALANAIARLTGKRIYRLPIPQPLV
ncbi:MAG: xanthine dehydrogenase family protein molybdopterin-binding subunit [Candidatus Marinimicrobia bacterium]|nr:xanthine dehydrogenase family protein molybdopterin-binding subunit [Candidatus Neomarinimicrobiota bacterium]MCF7902785.1 xanthine dehydrogenase family protein molybdopterin-binding subunit [Candidatus Neomarinimicrobiota bacterium]